MPGLALLKNWRVVTGLVGLIAVGIYIAILRGNLADAKKERDRLQREQTVAVGIVSSQLVRLGAPRTVTGKTLGDEFTWLAGEYLTVNGALKIQSEALIKARDEAEGVRVELGRALASAKARRADRDADAGAVLQGSGGLTDDEWSKL